MNYLKRKLQAMIMSSNTVRTLTTVSSDTGTITLPNSSGLPLKSLIISGNTIQSGIPAPTSYAPINNVGNLVTSGEHISKYAIPINIACGQLSQTITVYLDEPLCSGDTLEVMCGNLTATNVRVFFDGTEDITMHDSAIGRCGAFIFAANRYLTSGYCTHYAIKRSLPYANNSCYLGISNKVCYFVDNRFTTAAQVKAFMAEQYNLGSPVTVHYSQDAVQSQIAGVAIPTYKGNTIITIGTSTAPAALFAEYYI